MSITSVPRSRITDLIPLFGLINIADRINTRSDVRKSYRNRKIISEIENKKIRRRDFWYMAGICLLNIGYVVGAATAGYLLLKN